MAWTKVSKPNTTWTTVNPVGLEQYDQSNLTYDSATTYYDGIGVSPWTKVSKPNTSWTKVNKPT